VTEADPGEKSTRADWKSQSKERVYISGHRREEKKRALRIFTGAPSLHPGEKEGGRGGGGINKKPRNVYRGDCKFTLNS